MNLLVGACGFTSAKIRSLLNAEETIVVSRGDCPDSRSYQDWIRGGIPECLGAIKKYPIKKIIYTPSPYLDQISGFIEQLNGSGYSGKLGLFTTAAIVTNIPSHKRNWVKRAEEAASSAKFPTVVIRPNMIYGFPGDRNMEKLIRFLRITPAMLIPGDGNNLIQPIHRDDLAEGMVKAMNSADATGVIFASGPRPETFISLVNNVLKCLKRSWVPVIPFPVKLAQKGARLVPFLREDQILRFRESRAVDGSQFAKILGRPLMGLETGISREVELICSKNVPQITSH